MKKILIIEDDPEMNRLYERVFRLNGYEVEAFHDGESALGRLLSAKEPPSAIVMDVNVPRMNGLELLKTVRRTPAIGNIPVAVITNSFFKEDEEHFLSAGADLYLVKIDQNLQKVVSRIGELIQHKK